MRAKDDFSEYVFLQNSGDFTTSKLSESKNKSMSMKFHAIGLMSGTSLDGLDICFARFEKQDSWSFEIVKAETVSYPEYWEDQLRNCINFSAVELLELNSEYGFYLGKSVKISLINISLRM
ncbi:anhydro-N-acetylmuramic acid kinase [Chryseobacterium wanjuense]